MKKFIFGSGVFLVVLLLNGVVSRAWAVESLPISDVIGKENAVILEQTLSILRTILNDLQVKIENERIFFPDDRKINLMLGSINDNLLKIRENVHVFENIALNKFSESINESDELGIVSVDSGNESVGFADTEFENNEINSAVASTLFGNISKNWIVAIAVLIFFGAILIWKKASDSEVVV